MSFPNFGNFTLLSKLATGACLPPIELHYTRAQQFPKMEKIDGKREVSGHKQTRPRNATFWKRKTLFDAWKQEIELFSWIVYPKYQNSEPCWCAPGQPGRLLRLSDIYVAIIWMRTYKVLPEAKAKLQREKFSLSSRATKLFLNTHSGGFGIKRSEVARVNCVSIYWKNWYLKPPRIPVDC